MRPETNPTMEGGWGIFFHPAGSFFFFVQEISQIWQRREGDTIEDMRSAADAAKEENADRFTLLIRDADDDRSRGPQKADVTVNRQLIDIYGRD